MNMKRIITTITCAIAFASCALAQQTSPTSYTEKLVYQGKDVEFRQIDGHTWHGHGNMVYNEAIYVIEGNDKALVIDAGTNIPGLRKIIEGIAKDIEVGDVFTGTVARIMTFGAFVEYAPGKDGMIHISKLANHRVEKVEDVVNIGDELEVKVNEIDSQGRINLIRNDMVYENAAPRRPEGTGFRRPPRRDRDRSRSFSL